MVSVSPFKCNIMYAFTQAWQQCPRVIIYCHRFEDCADLYLFFRSYLGKKFTQPSGVPDFLSFRLVNMCMSAQTQI